MCNDCEMFHLVKSHAYTLNRTRKYRSIYLVPRLPCDSHEWSKKMNDSRELVTKEKYKPY